MPTSGRTCFTQVCIILYHALLFAARLENLLIAVIYSHSPCNRDLFTCACRPPSCGSCFSLWNKSNIFTAKCLMKLDECELLWDRKKWASRRSFNKLNNATNLRSLFPPAFKRVKTVKTMAENWMTLYLFLVLYFCRSIIFNFLYAICVHLGNLFKPTRSLSLSRHKYCGLSNLTVSQTWLQKHCCFVEGQLRVWELSVYRLMEGGGGEEGELGCVSEALFATMPRSSKSSALASRFSSTSMSTNLSAAEAILIRGLTTVRLWSLAMKGSFFSG